MFRRIVKSRTETAKGPIVNAGHEAVADSEVLLPPKVLVVESVVPVEQDQVVDQLINRGEIQNVDVRMRWSCPGVMTVSVHHNRNDWITHHGVEPGGMSTCEHKTVTCSCSKSTFL